MLNSFRLKPVWENRLRRNDVTSFDVLNPLRRWLDKLNICNPTQAHLICQIIPAQCPFEREIKIANRTYLKIPPLCKLNPLYEEVVGLRFRALTYLAETCPNDVCRYC